MQPKKLPPLPDGAVLVRPDVHPTSPAPSLPQENPAKEPITLLHFSDRDIKHGVLDGARRGSSGAGSEADRLDSSPTRALPGNYYYKDGARGEPQITSRPFRYTLATEAAVANIDENPKAMAVYALKVGEYKAQGMKEKEAQAAAINDAEHAIHGQGYDGYSASSHPHIVFLFGDQHVQPAHAVPSPPKTVVE